MMPRWLFASTPEAVTPITVRVADAEPLHAGTVLARIPGGPYVNHDPTAVGAVGVARAVLLQDVPGEVGTHQALAITRAATLVGRHLSDGRGIDRATHRDLVQNGLKVL